MNKTTAILLALVLVWPRVLSAGVEPGDTHESINCACWPRDHCAMPVEFRSHPSMASYAGDLVVFGIDGGWPENPLNGIARWDGETWQPMPGRWQRVDVRRHVLWRNQLVIAAEFRESDDHGKGLFTWDGRTWIPVSEDFSGTASALIEWRGLLVVAGQFTITGHPDLRHLAVWDGTSWHGLADAVAGGGQTGISALAVFRDDLVVGGTFTRIGACEAVNVARYDGTAWHDLGPGANSGIGGLGVFADQLFATGSFTCIGGQHLERVARWNGEAWLPLEVAAPFISRSGNPWVTMLTTPAGIVFRGRFSEVAGREASVVARWTEAGWDAAFKPPQARLPHARIIPAADSECDCPACCRQTVLKQPAVSTPTSPRVPAYRDLKLACIGWHDGRLLGLTIDFDDTGPTSQNHKMLAWNGDDWTRFLPRPNGLPGRMVGVYRGKLLLQGRRREWSDSPLATYADGKLEPLGIWPESASWPLRANVAVAGDTVVIAGDFFDETDAAFARIVCFNGEFWHAVGREPPPFRPAGEGLAVVDGAVYTAGYPLDYNCLHQARGLYRWDGLNWLLVDSTEQVYFGGPLLACGGDLFGIQGPKRAFDRAMTGPDNRVHRFPIDTHARVMRWTGHSWQVDWQGDTGAIAAARVYGDDLWLALAGGDRPTIVRRSGGTWQTVVAEPLAGKSETDFNGIEDFALFRGMPVVVGRFNDGMGGEPFGLAFWRDGTWQTTGRRFVFGKHAIATDERLWIVKETGRSWAQVADSMCPVTWWDGDLSAAVRVEPGDVDRMERLRAQCVSLRERGEPFLDLPWPEGVAKPECGSKDYDRTPWLRPGWQVNRWPVGRDLDDLIDQGGKTIVFDPLRLEDERVRFRIPCGSPGECIYRITFEFRMHAPVLTAEADSSVDLAAVRKSGNGLYSPRVALDMDDQRLVLDPALCLKATSWLDYSLVVSIREYEDLEFLPVSVEGIAQALEIRNLTIRPYDPDPAVIINELASRLAEACWPDSSTFTIEDVLAPARAAMSDPRNRCFEGMLQSCVPGLQDPGLGLSPRPDYKALNRRWADVDRPALESLLVNTGSDPNLRSGWIPGGAYYRQIGTVPFRGSRENKGISGPFSAAGDGLTRVLVVDLRRGWGGAYIHPRRQFEYAAIWLGEFAAEPVTWGTVIVGRPGDCFAEAKPATIEPITGATPEIPVVFLVGERTPGHIVMMLNALENVTTIGRPSAPVLVPTKPAQLSNGAWVYLPAGALLDPGGRDVSYRRIEPAILVPEGSPYDWALREAVTLFGIDPDQEPSFCPR